jgi:hypothetical protein
VKSGLISGSKHEKCRYSMNQPIPLGDACACAFTAIPAENRNIYPVGTSFACLVSWFVINAFKNLLLVKREGKTVCFIF